MAENYHAMAVQGDHSLIVLPVCSTCGSVVTQQTVAQHDEWHRKLRTGDAIQ